MSRRPNILLVTADQWRGDALSAAGHPAPRTPHVDALAAGGCRFARHYAASAPCSPARASLYTGLHQMTHRVVWNGTPLDGRFDNVARAARRAGYLPTLFGYTDTAPDPRGMDPHDPALLTYEGVLPGFVQRQPLPEDDRPWLAWLAGRGHEAPTRDLHAAPPQPGERVSLAPPGYAADETQTAFLADRFLSWLGEQDAGTPWFAHVSFLRPHPPFSVPEPYASMYPPDEAMPFGGPPDRAEAAALHPLVAVQQGQSLGSFLHGAEGRISDLSRRDLARIRALYWGMVSEVDDQIGRLVAGLKAAGMWEDTLVVLTSDHGEMMGDHFVLGKGGFLPASYHVPLVLHGPGVRPGGTVGAFTSAVDVFPTLLEAMGVTPAHAPDGRSLMPFARGETPAWRDHALWAFDFRHPARDAGFDLPPEDCCLVARLTDGLLYVHSPAFGALLLDLSDPLAPRPVDDPAQRLAQAEALLADRARLAEATLTGRMVWDWAAPASAPA